jgi:hypothetical protein
MHVRLLVLFGIVLPLVGGIGGYLLAFALAARRGGWKQRVPLPVIWSAIFGLLLGIVIPVLLLVGVIR